MNQDQRKHVRVAGPFDGLRIGLLETPVRIYDLSEGGCFVSSLYEGVTGESLVLKIQLPHEGWVKVEGEILYSRPEFGFAMRFANLTEHARASLAGVVQKLTRKASQAA
jgi:PilZ domain-containing protein